MLKRSLLLATAVCTGLAFFTTNIHAAEKSNLHDKQAMFQTLIESDAIKVQNDLTKVPSMLDIDSDIAGLKKYKQSLAEKNKVMGKISIHSHANYSNPIILKDLSLVNPSANRDCDAGYVQDCVDEDCCPESWIGDGFADCEDQAYGCDLTCYDNDGGDCAGGTGGTTGGGSEDCSDCEYDFTNYGSECCDTAWDEYGINCAQLESNYFWDCSGC